MSAEHLVRRCFVPKDPDYCFVMIDYDQMEYRLMLDISEEMGVIAKIKSGLDVHTATGEMMGVTRQQAKTLNFMLLYGGGVAKLAHSLSITEHQARSLREKYFKDLAREGLDLPSEEAIQALVDQKVQIELEKQLKNLPAQVQNVATELLQPARPAQPPESGSGAGDSPA